MRVHLCVLLYTWVYLWWNSCACAPVMMHFMSTSSNWLARVEGESNSSDGVCCSNSGVGRRHTLYAWIHTVTTSSLCCRLIFRNYWLDVNPIIIQKTRSSVSRSRLWGHHLQNMSEMEYNKHSYVYRHCRSSSRERHVAPACVYNSPERTN